MSGAGQEETGAVIVAAARTPIAARGRALASMAAHELAGVALAEVARRTGTRPEQVMLGSSLGDGGNLGRRAALAAGFGVGCPGWTVDAQCGSSLVALQQAAATVEQDGGVVAAGGAESVSGLPEERRAGGGVHQRPFSGAGFPDPDMTSAADDLAARRGIPRRRQEAFARRSHALARRHAARDRTEDSTPLAPFGGIVDDGPRRLTPALTSRFRAVREEPDATITPATAARPADGAAALLLMPAARARALGLSGVRVRGRALIGADPALPGIAAAPAAAQVLAATGTRLEDLAAVEIVEAYAAQALACLDALGLGAGDPRVDADGGALALGHPWGASPAVAATHLVHRLAAAPAGARGLIACAIGGGMGAALLVEAVDGREGLCGASADS
ncbi:acetyl-CoA C-acyltransferase [Nesterenkonia halophila]|uniref:thiolase family protein n=1 Tax=Nesterenkonia halophila TaxID=302044 RepID=UPI001290F8E0|nr:acetyl-CoA C-acyltransferase [Nesterenkonia halophila]